MSRILPLNQKNSHLILLVKLKFVKHKGRIKLILGVWIHLVRTGQGDSFSSWRLPIGYSDCWVGKFLRYWVASCWGVNGGDCMNALWVLGLCFWQQCWRACKYESTALGGLCGGGCWEYFDRVGNKGNAFLLTQENWRP